MLNIILNRVLQATKILWLVLILSSSQLLSQIPSPLFGPLPEGDDIWTDSHPVLKRENLKVIVGKKFIEFGFKGQTGLYNTNISYYSTPIKDSGFKKGSDNTYFVLLENGTFYKLTVSGTSEYIGIRTEWFGGPTRSNPTPPSIDFDKIVGDALYILSTAGVYVSRDTGATWQMDTTGLGSVSPWDIALDSAQYVYAATDNGLYIQSPDSNSWRQINSSDFNFVHNFSKVYIDRTEKIFLAINGGGIFMSSDHGSTWSIDTTGFGSGFQIANTFGDDAFGNVYVATSSFSVTPNAIFKSSGGTSPWTSIDQGITAITVNQPIINTIGGDSTLYAGTSFGLYSSTDQGNTWTESNAGIHAETFNGFAEAKNGRLIVSTALAIYTKDLNDTSWTKRFPVKGYEANLPLYQDGLGNLYTIEPVKNSFGNIIKSTDNGTTWIYDTLGLSSISASLFYVDENGIQYLTGSIYNGSYYKSVVYQKKLGGSWVPDTSGALAFVSFVNSMASDQHGYLYMSVYWNTTVSSQTQGVVRKSINGGVWTIDSSGIPPGFNYFYQMEADKNGMMYGHDYFHLMRRTNTGWVSVPVPNQIPGTYYTAFTFDSSNTLFAALEEYSYATGRSLGRGVYFTTNQGANWTFAGLDSLTVQQLLSYGNTTYVITDRGIYIVNKNGATAVKEQNQIPIQYELSQNYPNPFNPTTTITYQIPKEGFVKLKIYDILGNEVKTLVNGYKPAGRYKINFDASRFASGVYFYRLNINNYTSTKKLVLLK